MAFIYITGFEGSGKSTVCTELKRRGYDAHDMDEEGIACMHSKKTGLPDTDILDYRLRTPKWTAEHSWLILKDKIEQLAIRAEHATLFLCGTAEDEKEYTYLFDTIIALYVDKKILTHRILSRTGRNTYGKAPHEMEIIMRKYNTTVQDYQELNALIVDSSVPNDRVVDIILDKISERNQ